MCVAHARHPSINFQQHGDALADNLNLVLQELRTAISESGNVPVLIAESALETQFHGLNLHQLAMLTDAPALGIVGKLRTEDGAQVERFAIDGKNAEQCASAAQQLLLDANASFKVGEIREVTVRSDSMPDRTFVRDHNNIIYRITDKEAAIDPELTGALQQRCQRGQYDGAPPQQPVIVNEVLRCLAAARQCNGIAFQEIRKLIDTTGGRDLESALAAAKPELLRAAFEQIMLASQQIETLLGAVDQRAKALLRVVEQGGAASSPPEARSTAGPQIVPAKAASDDDSDRFPHEPF